MCFSDLEASDEGEPAISDDLEAEYTEENPFFFEGDEDDVTNAEVNIYPKFCCQRKFFLHKLKLINYKAYKLKKASPNESILMQFSSAPLQSKKD